MKFLPFFDEFPELIRTEFRNIFVLENEIHQHIPPGNYAFLEMFCPDTECDCRKVIIHVISSPPFKTWAILNYGWEPEEYYKSWWGKNSRRYKPMSGISFDPPTHDPLKNEFLTIFENIINEDKNYAKRIESHYCMFKEKMFEKQSNRLSAKKLSIRLPQNKSRRNDPCPCNSGKKFKQCCLIN